MREATNTLESEPRTVEREWTVDGIPVLTASVSLPRPLSGEKRVRRRIDRFYALYGRAYLRYCESWLLPQAQAEYRLALENSGPLPHFTAQLRYWVSFNDQGIWSLYTQSREQALGRAELLRRGDTWDLRTGYPMPLSAFFPRRQLPRRLLVETAEAEMAAQEAAGLARYHDNWRQALRRQFSRENFYLSPQGLHFFYPMYALGGAVEGIPTFCLPFSPELCRLPSSAPALPKRPGR